MTQTNTVSTLTSAWQVYDSVAQAARQAVLGLVEGKTGKVTLNLSNDQGPDYVLEIRTKRARVTRLPQTAAKCARKKATRRSATTTRTRRPRTTTPTV